MDRSILRRCMLANRALNLTAFGPQVNAMIVSQTRASVSRLSYIVLPCADLERSREFYEALGLKLVPEQHGSGVKHYSSDVGGVILELYPSAANLNLGLQLGLVIPDLSRVVEALGSRWRTVTMNESGGVATVTVKDPDGRRLELRAG